MSRREPFWPSLKNSGDLRDTLLAARTVSARSNITLYVFATMLGFGIYRNPPAFRQGFYTVKGGKIELTRATFSTGE